MTAKNEGCVQQGPSERPSGHRRSLAGFARERRSILSAIRSGRSLLVLGPAGSGKTALLEWANDSAGDACLSIVQSYETLHDLLVNTARALLQSGHRAFCRAAYSGADSEKWLRNQSSLHLKGLLWAALGAEPRTLILDGVHGASHRTYRFLQQLYFTPGMAIIAAARSEPDLGVLRRLFWDPRERLYLRPLSSREALRLFDMAAERFGLQHLDLDDFRAKAVHASRGNPGKIVEMCRLASIPQYSSRGRIKFSLIQIETKTRFLG